jgi:hypothetical protein
MSEWPSAATPVARAAGHRGDREQDADDASAHRRGAALEAVHPRRATAGSHRRAQQHDEHRAEERHLPAPCQIVPGQPDERGGAGEHKAAADVPEDLEPPTALPPRRGIRLVQRSQDRAGLAGGENSNADQVTYRCVPLPGRGIHVVLPMPPRRPRWTGHRTIWYPTLQASAGVVPMRQRRRSQGGRGVVHDRRTGRG